MDEKILVKSDRFDVKKISIAIVALGFILMILYAVFSVSNYTSAYNRLAAKNYDWFDYSSPLDMALQQDGGFIVAFLLPVAAVIIAVIVYKALSVIELTVTDKRVYGCATFGKRVDLPIDSISAVGTGMFNTIAITTASGAIRFGFIKNRDAIHSTVSKLLVERQNKPVAATVVTREIPQSNADELKKYKELLDSGIISQDEFDAKKKQLLNL